MRARHSGSGSFEPIPLRHSAGFTPDFPYFTQVRRRIPGAWREGIAVFGLRPASRYFGISVFEIPAIKVWKRESDPQRRNTGRSPNTVTPQYRAQPGKHNAPQPFSPPRYTSIGDHLDPFCACWPTEAVSYSRHYE